MSETIERLRESEIQPTAQRIAVAEVVFGPADHPTADEVWERVRREHPTMSRATVYNALNLFAEKGLLRRQVLREGTVVFDSHVAPHHHFIDEETGEIFDIPWDALDVTRVDDLEQFDVREFQVVMRGRRRSRDSGQ